MSKLVWDQTGEHFYETGVDQGVLFVYDETNHTYGAGVAWNGLTAVNQNPTGADANALYADNIKYLNLFSNMLSVTILVPSQSARVVVI